MRARAILDFPPESEIHTQSRMTNSYYHAGGWRPGKRDAGRFLNCNRCRMGRDGGPSLEAVRLHLNVQV